MEDFINQLIQAKGLPADIDEEVRKQLVQDMAARAQDLITRRLLEAMPDAAVDEFNRMIDQSATTPQMVQEFVANHVPNRDEITRRALEEFRDLYLGTNGTGSQNK